MSGVSSWLQRMRKAELLELADSVGFKDYDGLKKTEVEAALDSYLKDNASTYSAEARLEPFYKRRSESSPVKKESASTSSLLDEAGTQVKSVKRRVIKATEELIATDESEIEPAATRARALARTPRARVQSLAASVPLPPSPAVVADAIDRRTSAIRARISDAYQDSGIIEKTYETREVLSTIFTVHSLIVAFELWNLRPEVLPNRYAFTVPANKFLGTSAYPVNIPDLFLLLTASFWGPATLWSFTSLFIPLFVSYFINLTSKPARQGHISHFNYEFDPLVFNVVKALLTFVIYGQSVTFGIVDLENVARINSAIYGGWKGVLTGNAIGVLVTIYEAIVKK